MAFAAVATPEIRPTLEERGRPEIIPLDAPWQGPDDAPFDDAPDDSALTRTRPIATSPTTPTPARPRRPRRGCCACPSPGSNPNGSRRRRGPWPP
jgi:hypothetical protein